MKSRDAKIDGLKFLMIYCVVLAHIRYNDYGLELNKMIYAFHMPVFIFLSGYLTSLKATMEKRLSWCKHTLIIYVFAQIFHLLLALASGYVLMVNTKMQLCIHINTPFRSYMPHIWQNLSFPCVCDKHLKCTGMFPLFDDF